MSDATHLVPQAERLLRRIEGLEVPLVELWGWPGSGSSAVLQALLARQDVAGLALADLAPEEPARAALAAATVRRLVVAGDPAEYLDDLAGWLRPGQQLVFATRRRLRAGLLAVALLPPQELLLTVPEVARLWYLVCGKQPGAGTAEALWLASDGWFQPLRLALEATGGAGLEVATAEQLLELSPVRLFLRHEVLDALPATERELLLAAPRERPAAGEELRDAPGGAGASGAAGAAGAEGGEAGGDAGLAAWRLVDELGFWVEGGDRDRLPALLAACLDRERRRRRPRAEKRGRSGGAARSRPGSGAAPSGPGAARSGPGGDPSMAGAAGAEGAAGAVGLAGVTALEATVRHAYRVRLFGGPTVRQLTADGEREVGWKLRRSFQVLAFLASSPDLQAGREELEEAVWPSDGERTIDRNFHPTLSHLRRALERQRGGSVPQPLLFRAGIYRLNPEIEWHIDLQDFNRLVVEGRELIARREDGAAADCWQGAWKLYRGPFLQGYYQAWVMSRREACQQAYVELLRDLGDLSMRLERSEDALDSYRAVLLEDPLQERTHLAVMRLYAAQGRRDLVRRQYERLCTLLLDELGVEPLPETVQEYHRLMS
ncbi:MAG TPA: BTAD domain-containing putative transcriptional regulator [Thermoanaerobaculia bacterium]|nr:BTAD domain-containing putative transcriptional regulator [Thermoanaerobaculia bacterium]